MEGFRALSSRCEASLIYVTQKILLAGRRMASEVVSLKVGGHEFPFCSQLSSDLAL